MLSGSSSLALSASDMRSTSTPRLVASAARRCRKCKMQNVKCRIKGLWQCGCSAERKGNSHDFKTRLHTDDSFDARRCYVDFWSYTRRCDRGITESCDYLYGVHRDRIDTEYTGFADCFLPRSLPG